MIQTIISDGKAEFDYLQALKARQQETNADVTRAVQDILDDVRREGDAAVTRYSAKFDHAEGPIRVIEAAEIADAKSRIDAELLGAMERAAVNIRRFHKQQVQESYVDFREDGSMMGQRVRPLKRVGLYVPGGTAAYPSSVLMNAIPAKIAGVPELVMVTPPNAEGKPRDVILAAAAVAGVDRIYMVGGAQAVAALAYGTETIPQVDKIVGPGNIFVATAKRLLYGVVDIDMIAGPSEILIVADENADPRFVAADLMSQCEHDVLAGGVLLTDSAVLRSSASPWQITASLSFFLTSTPASITPTPSRRSISSSPSHSQSNTSAVSKTPALSFSATGHRSLSAIITLAPTMCSQPAAPPVSFRRSASTASTSAWASPPTANRRS